MDQEPQKSVEQLEIAYEQALAYAQELKKEIAERKRIEQALRESEEKYRTLIEQSSDAIFLLYGGRFEVINTRGHIENGKVVYWQVTITVGFTLED